MTRLTRHNRTLLAAAAVLLLLSAFTYRDSVTRAERFERGQKFLPHLNPDEIAKIEIEKGEEATVLERTADGERFVLPSEDGYYAANREVNRFVKDVLGIGLEKEVGAGETLNQRLGLVADDEDVLEVAFSDAAGKEMVRFLVAEPGEEGGEGSFVRRLDAPDASVYLTERRVYLDTGGESFLDKQILDVQRDDIASIRGADYTFLREGLAPPPAAAEGGEEEAEVATPAEGEDLEPGELELVDLPAGKKKSAKASQLEGALSNLRFTEHHLADAPEVQGLVFDTRVRFQLEDGSGYEVELAEREGEHFLRIGGFHTAGRILIAQDADEEEVRETSEILERADEIQQWNAFHGSWIYEVTESVADRFRVSATDLVEDA